MEHIFRKPFPSAWPSWLIGKKGRPLQLDGLNEALGIAFEHQGKQHYQNIPFLHTRRNLQATKEIDQLKREVCRRKGIILIEIPEVPTLLPVGLLPQFIAKTLERNRVHFSKARALTVSFDLSTPAIQLKFERLSTYAVSHGGSLLSESYLGAFTKHQFRCSKGHKWSAIPANMFRKNYWCPECGLAKRISSQIKGSMEEMHALAKSKNGKFISKKFRGISFKHKWKCNECMTCWSKAPREIIGYGGRTGTWCPRCR